MHICGMIQTPAATGTCKWPFMYSHKIHLRIPKLSMSCATWFCVERCCSQDQSVCWNDSLSVLTAKANLSFTQSVAMENYCTGLKSATGCKRQNDEWYLGFEFWQYFRTFFLFFIFTIRIFHICSHVRLSRKPFLRYCQYFSSSSA